MVPRIKTSFLVFLVLFIYLSLGTVKGFSNGESSTHSLHEVGVGINSRKLLSHDEVLDYEDAGANTKHDPNSKGKRGGGGKNL